MRLHLKKGEKLFLNGAVIQAEQRCCLALLNNATFLLETHVMQAEAATTPLRQLYFAVQTMLIEPENRSFSRELYWHQSNCLHAALSHEILVQGLHVIDGCIKTGRLFEALKLLRQLFPIETGVLDPKQHREVA